MWSGPEDGPEGGGQRAEGERHFEDPFRGNGISGGNAFEADLVGDQPSGGVDNLWVHTRQVSGSAPVARSHEQSLLGSQQGPAAGGGVAAGGGLMQRRAKGGHLDLHRHPSFGASKDLGFEQVPTRQ